MEKTKLQVACEDYDILEEVCNFIDFEMPILNEDEIIGGIKELCVAKLCDVVGIRGAYNYKSEFLSFFSDVVAEAVVEILGYKFHIASERLRFFSFDHVNLVCAAKKLMLNENKDEAFIDAFNLIDKFKYIIPRLKNA